MDQFGIDFQSLGIQFTVLGFSFTLRYYGMILMTGVVAAAFLASRLLKSDRKNPDIAWDALIWVLVFGVIGARLYHILTPSISAVDQGKDVRLNLLRVGPDGFRANDSNIPVVLQLLYNRQESSVLIASGIEAALIQAEAAVRVGQTATAAQLLNALRSDYSLRLLLRSRVDLPSAGNQLAPLTLTGNLLFDLKIVADERARELWLTGDRMTTSRRFRLELGIDLFPSVKTAIGGGDDIAFPIPQLELDTNPNLGTDEACPADQVLGGWR